MLYTFTQINCREQNFFIIQNIVEFEINFHLNQSNIQFVSIFVIYIKSINFDFIIVD